MFRFLLPLVFYTTATQALVLEQLIESGTLKKTLAHKKVGYYIGSFDPLHLGHQDTVQISLDKKLVDYVLIFPNWGGDTYKNRIPVKKRLKMLFAVYKDHPQVIVTKLSPREMQKHLTCPDYPRTIAEKPAVKTTFKGTKFIGIIGSDSALKLSIPLQMSQQENERQKHLSIFMRGIQIPNKYAQNTEGSFLALSVDSFIVSLRKGDKLTPLKGTIVDRPIVAVIQSDSYNHTSSTLVKKNLKEHKPINQMVDPVVLTIINKDHLYQE